MEVVGEKASSISSCEEGPGPLGVQAADTSVTLGNLLPSRRGRVFQGRTTLGF